MRGEQTTIERKSFSLFAVRTPIIKEGDNLIDVLVDSLRDVGESLHPGDVVVVAETVVSTCQGRIVDLQAIDEVSDEARELAKKHSMDSRLVQLVLDESENVLGGVEHVLLARVKGLLLANAGIDASNSGGTNLVSLLPNNPWETIRTFRNELQQRSGVEPLGAILADSRVQPLKKGVLGGALAVSGFLPVEDRRGQEDLFGRPLRITQIAVADDLASAAELLMGEANEQTPFVIIRDAPVKFVPDDEIPEDIMLMPDEECLFVNVFRQYTPDLGAGENIARQRTNDRELEQDRCEDRDASKNLAQDDGHG